MVERWGYLWVRKVLQPKFGVSDGPIIRDLPGFRVEAVTDWQQITRTYRPRPCWSAVNCPYHRCRPKPRLEGAIEARLVQGSYFSQSIVFLARELGKVYV